MQTSTTKPVTRRRLFRQGSALGSAFAVSWLAACTRAESDAPAAQVAAPTALPQETSAPRRGGTITSEWQTTSNLWDPYRVSTGVVQHYSNLFETLVTSNPKTLEIEPLLIQSWEEIEPGLHYVLKVRNGMAWENKAPTRGRTFGAEDVVYNLKYASGLLDPARAGQIARSSWHQGLETVRAVDANTVEMRLGEPNAAILAAMADMRQFVIPREIPDQMPFTEYANFPSMGPFITREYRDGEGARYERNPNYWNTQLPHVDSVSIKWYGDSASAAAALLAGEIDLFRPSGKQQNDQIEKSGRDAVVYSFPFRSHNSFYINADRVPDSRIWKALHFAFDYAKANDAIYGSGKWEYSGPINRVLPGASPSEVIAQLPGYSSANREADRKEAAALLSAAGHPEGEGLSIELLSSASSGAAFDIAIYFQADVKQAAPKIKFDVRPAPDGASFQRSLASREYQAMGYTIYEALDSRLAAINWKSGGSRNYSNYSNPRVDELVDKSFAQTFTESQSTIKEIEKIILEAQPLILATGIFDAVAASSRVKGLTDRLGPGCGGQYNETSKARKFVWVVD